MFRRRRLVRCRLEGSDKFQRHRVIGLDTPPLANDVGAERLQQDEWMILATPYQLPHRSPLSFGEARATPSARAWPTRRSGVCFSRSSIQAYPGPDSEGTADLLPSKTRQDKGPLIIPPLLSGSARGALSLSVPAAIPIFVTASSAPGRALPGAGSSPEDGARPLAGGVDLVQRRISNGARSK